MRTVLSIMQEIASSAMFFAPILREGRVPSFDEISPDVPDSVEECIRQARSITSEICTLISQVPDSQLEDEQTMPFGGGMKMTMADILGLHHWNLVYHLGQINQVQLMLGDTEMH